MPLTLQASILDKLGTLADQAPEGWSAEEHIERWWPNENLYALHVWVGADELLVFFYPEGTCIHVDSMLLKEAIDRYARKS